MTSGTGEWRAKPTATDPTMRWMAWVRHVRHVTRVDQPLVSGTVRLRSGGRPLTRRGADAEVAHVGMQRRCAAFSSAQVESPARGRDGPPLAYRFSSGTQRRRALWVSPSQLSRAHAAIGQTVVRACPRPPTPMI